MFARLWWKDVRQFWPILAILAATAAACQFLLLRYGGREVRDGVLPVVAMGWVLLYAFAVSSAAFAGERENDTLSFLDMIPVGRKVLWGGKASFALTSTMGLALALAAMAWLGSDRLLPWGQSRTYALGPLYTIPTVTLGVTALIVLAVLLEVLGWGLLWSAASSNAMIAAVLTMACSAFALPLIRRSWVSDEGNLVASVPWRLGLALVTSAFSFLLIASGERPRRPLGDVLNVEISVKRRQAARACPRRRLLSPTFKVLVWESFREAWPVWWRLGVIGFGGPLFLSMSGALIDPGVILILNYFLAVAAGVAVFGAENRGRSHRFLAHHGARPGVVWAVKVGVWASALVPYVAAVSTWLAVASLEGSRGRTGGPLSIPFLLVMMTGGAVGVVSGMAIRRGITAGLVAVLGVLAVGLPQVAMLSWGVLPWVIPPLVPLALLAVSWGWSGDWMLDRAGPALGAAALLLSAAFLGVFAVLVGVRVGTARDLGPGFDVPAFLRSAEVDPKDNAADLYRQAFQRLDALNLEVLSTRGNGEVVMATRRRPTDRERAEILDILRRASAMPACRFVRLDRVTRFNELSDRDLQRLRSLTFMVAESSRTRQNAGDLAGTWDDLMVLFRMARQLNGPVPVAQSLSGLTAEADALAQVLSWSADSRQTPERVKAALDAYQALPAMPSAVATIRAESILARNTLRLSGPELASLNRDQMPRGPNLFEEVAYSVRSAALTSPWEVARARRVLRSSFAVLASRAADRPTVRQDIYNFWAERDPVFGSPTSTPLVNSFLPGAASVIEQNDRNEVARRALVQVLALRHWQLTHGGKLPGSLDVLLSSGDLRELPADPYSPSGGPFHYVRSTGLWLPIIGYRPDTGQWLLYSVGPDGKDDGGYVPYDSRDPHGDIVFPLTEGEGAGVEKSPPPPLVPDRP